ncbi:MAG TPA: glycosyltransferase [Candidatus Fusicatenibacter intestinipullorum]|nr:glycosyltransferase [Candidatus Fusicatenibacter intestinipullorum]
MKFTVLMSVYYKEKPEYLQLALKSIINQTVKPNEIVLVEDGKLTNELQAVITKYKQNYPDIFKTYALQQNQGLGKALNFGMQKCSNELIARMDTDDIAEPNRFELQIKEFEKDGELALCGGQIAEFADNPKVITGYRNVPTEHNEILNFVKKRNPFNHMTVMLKKQAVQSVGGYQHMPYFEDYWLWVRMFKAGYKAKNVDQVLVKVRAGQEMIARRGGLNYAMCIIRFEKALNGIGVINIAEMIGYVTLRSIVSIMPESLRLWIYGCKLRK